MVQSINLYGREDNKKKQPGNPSPGIQKDDQPDIETCDPEGLFSEDCDLRHPGSAQDNFKKEFSTPMYDEYEEEYLWAVPEKLAIEPGPVDGEDQDSMRSQEVKAEKVDKGTEGDNLPLCYSSFELI